MYSKLTTLLRGDCSQEWRTMSMTMLYTKWNNTPTYTHTRRIYYTTCINNCGRPHSHLQRGRRIRRSAIMDCDPSWIATCSLWTLWRSQNGVAEFDGLRPLQLQIHPSHCNHTHTSYIRLNRNTQECARDIRTYACQFCKCHIYSTFGLHDRNRYIRL